MNDDMNDKNSAKIIRIGFGVFLQGWYARSAQTVAFGSVAPGLLLRPKGGLVTFF
jgi:hypothetical protein